MSLGCRLRPGSSTFFIKNQFQVLKVKFFVQSETKARFFTGKFIVFVNIFVFKSSVSLLNISLQLLTCPAIPLSAYNLLCNEMGPRARLQEEGSPYSNGQVNVITKDNH